jgi:hypothetical protein
MSTAKYVPVSQGDIDDKAENPTSIPGSGAYNRRTVFIVTIIICFNLVVAALSAVQNRQIFLLLENSRKEDDIYSLPRPDPLFGLIKQPST